MVKLASPGGKLQAEVSLHHGRLSYAVFLDESMVIDPSALGLVRNDGDFSTELSRLTCSKSVIRKEEYTMLQGKQRKIHSKYSSYTCHVSNPAQQRLSVQFALSDLSVAFRYSFPEDDSIDSRTILRENTTFAIRKSPGDFQLLQPYDTPVPKYQTFYQPRNNRTLARIGGVSGAGNSSTGFAYLALFKTQTNESDVWIHLKEAGFDGQYPASHIAQVSTDGMVSLGFPSDLDGNGAFGSGRPQSILPWTTPWRIITIGTSPATIIGDHSTTDLSEASQILNTSWIKPGVASWSWWANPTNPSNYTATKEFIDLASRQHWRHFLQDSKWDQKTDSDGRNVSLETVVDYARSKNVGIWLWINSAGPNNNATYNTPRDLLYDRSVRRATMERLARLGVAGLKVDGIQSDKQQMMAYLLDILRDAADFHLMIVLHNCPLPHGWERTWPNLLSSEALVASEYYANADTSYAPQIPENNVNEAFVRVPIGPADYTPGVFSTAQYVHNAIHTTYAHEMALNIIMDTGLRVLPDTPESYEQLIPSELTGLLGSLPFVWDETVFVQGDAGKSFVVAKRSGRSLYIAGINGETLSIAKSTSNDTAVGVARDLTIDLSSLSRERPLGTAFLIADVNGSRTCTVSRDGLNATYPLLKVHMEPFGGFVYRIEEES
ncbi:hypothetical protein PRZ48_006097 [Zasmidium cellare]|uniref:alpha-galactosidase n=1 Tax=Zasmidium cellare TaxID=395010 RepID=A0ABR0ENE6_ZASCE|nr:hypothetical protein PRZ48_006097 [Zasmidium cellare]